MDTSKLIADVKIRFQQHESKLYLQEKYKNRLQFAYGGGMWTINPTFISFLGCFNGMVVLEDLYNNPVKVSAPELKDKAVEIYTQVMDDWYAEHQELVKNR